MTISAIERHLFFEGIFLRYGYDFRQYSESSLDRRLTVLLQHFQKNSLLEVLELVLNDSELFRKALADLTISTTEFFRDPLFFKELRESVFPLFKTYSRIHIWSAGCSTGEEVLSLAIALKEENLLKRTTIHATDINPSALKKAKSATYDADCIPLFNRNYSLAGGSASPSEYYTAEYGLVRFHQELSENIVFSEHNLVTDSDFLEANLILCRNVLIYFSRDLQNRALELFTRSLAHNGFLGIGSKESLRFSPVAHYFNELPGNLNLFSFQSLSKHLGGSREKN